MVAGVLVVLAAGGQAQDTPASRLREPIIGLPCEGCVHVIEVGRCTYYIDSIHFENDPVLSADDREQAREGRGGGGLAQPRGSNDHGWEVTHDIILGEGIPGYSGCDRPI